MEISTEIAVWIPPLIIVRGMEFYICGAGCDPHSWLESEINKRKGSFVIFDPDRSLRKRYGWIFSDKGYGMKVLDLTNVRMSTRYNPFEYILNDKGVIQFTAALMSGTKGLGELSDIDFIALETALLTALVVYIHDEVPCDELNIHTVGEMLDAMIQEDGFYEDGYIPAVDYMMDQKEEYDPESLSVRMYRTFRRITGESIRRVVESCAARIAPLDTEEMHNFLSTDEFELFSLGFRYNAVFITPGSDCGGVTAFLTPLMYAQLNNVLCKMAAD